jgi:hypothetical protein
VEECTYFRGVNTSWGIDTAESKGPLNQEDNQDPQPTFRSQFLSLNMGNQRIRERKSSRKKKLIEKVEEEREKEKLRM